MKVLHIIKNYFEVCVHSLGYTKVIPSITAINSNDFKFKCFIQDGSVNTTLNKTSVLTTKPNTINN